MNAADELIGAFDEGADSDEIHARKGKKKEKKEDKKKGKKKEEEEEIVPEYPKNVTYCSSKFLY